MGNLHYTIFGAGAVGGVIASQLAQAGNGVSVVARGAHLETIKHCGLTFLGLNQAQKSQKLAASSNPRDLQPADVVVVTVKAHSIAALAADIDAARKPGGLVVFVQNGLPWWLASAGMRKSALTALDPQGKMAATFPACAAGIAYFGAVVSSAGVIRQTAPGKIVLGAALGGHDARMDVLARALSAAGADTELSADIREAVWKKLQVNVGLNALAALTRKPIADILDSVPLRPILSSLADEVGEIAHACGYETSFDIERQRAIVRPGQKSSTLQDMEAGKAIEYAALFGSVLELAETLAIPMPTLNMIAPLIFEASDVRA